MVTVRFSDELKEHLNTYQQEHQILSEADTVRQIVAQFFEYPVNIQALVLKRVLVIDKVLERFLYGYLEGIDPPLATRLLKEYDQILGEEEQMAAETLDLEQARQDSLKYLRSQQKGVKE